MTNELYRFTCWNTQRARKVLDPIALELSEKDFLAVHTPVPLALGNAVHEARTVVSEESLLLGFLEPEDRYRFFMVVGQPGTGKSHLIRWAYTRTPTTEARLSLLIPRALTNLRGVLEMILRHFPQASFDKYRGRLQQAVTPPTAEAGREYLLNALAEVLKHEYVEGDPAEASAEKHAAKILPALFYEPWFREHYWLRKKGPLARIYDAALGANTEGVGEGDGTSFSPDDLPHDLAEGRLANPAVLLDYNQLQSSPQLQEAAVRVLNRHLDLAAQRLLGFNGENLSNLMLDIRRELMQQGRELVLFIEDISRLQGLDASLLESIIVGPEQLQDDPLSPIRSMVGTTDGPYRRLERNVQQRITHVVDLDASLEPQSSDALVPIAARYLNALRLDRAVLDTWDGEGDPPSACDTCPHQTVCHQAFGAHEGRGFYPFTAQALGVMYTRRQPGSPNPRLLLQEVLQPVVRDHAPDIEQGTFPNVVLHNHFGGAKASGWSASEVSAVEQYGPQGPRLFALLDLWSAGQQPRNLDADVHAAFGLPLLPKDLEKANARPAPWPVPQARVPLPSAAVEPSSRPAATPSTPRPAPPDPVLVGLDAWGRGQAINATLLTPVRRVLVDAVGTRLDADREHFTSTVLSTFVKPPTFNLKGQDVSLGQSGIQVVLPLKGQNRLQVAVALQALYQHSRARTWTFDDTGAQRLAAARVLDEVCQEVVRQIRHLGGSRRAWNPGVAAAEGLRLIARLAGQPEPSKTSRVDKLEALLTPVDMPDLSLAEPAWKRTVEKLFAQQQPLRDLVDAFLLCPKGGFRTALFDATHLLPVLQAVNVLPTLPLPEPLPSQLALNRLADVQQYASRLSGAAGDEVDKWRAWHEEVTPLLPADVGVEDVKEALRDVRRRLDKAGVGHLTPGDLRDWEGAARLLQPESYARLRALVSTLAEGGAVGEGASLSAVLRTLGYLAPLKRTAEAVQRYVLLSVLMMEEAEKRMTEGLLGEEHAIEEAVATLQQLLSDLVDSLPTSPLPDA